MEKYKVVFLVLVILLVGCTNNNKKNEEPLAFEDIYTKAIDNLLNANSYSLQLDYNLYLSANDKIVSETNLQIDNVNSVVLINENIRTVSNGYIVNSLSGQTKQFVRDGDKFYFYTSYIDNDDRKYYTYTELNSELILKEINDSLLSLETNEVEIIPNFNIINNMSDVDITKTPEQDYQYKVTLNYKQLKEEFNVLYELEETLGINNSNFDNCQITIQYKFDMEKELLKEIEINLGPLIKSMLQSIFPNEEMKIGRCYLLFTFEKYGEVKLNKPSNVNYIFDDYYNELDQNIYYKDSTNIYNTISGVINYPVDKDIIKIKVPEKDKYLVKLKQDDFPIKIEIFDNDGFPLKELYSNSTTSEEEFKFNQFAIELDVGEYFISVEYSSSRQKFNYTSDTSYDIIFEKLENDDYADVFKNESIYPIKDINNSEILTGSVNFIGDFDIFKIIRTKGDLICINTTNENLMLIEKLQGNYGNISYTEYEPIDGEINIKIDKTKQGQLYYAIISDNYVGDYAIDIEYYNDLNDSPAVLYDKNTPRYLLGNNYRGAFHLGDKSDFIKFEVDEEGYYNFNLMYIRPDNNIEIVLYDSDNTEIFKSNSNQSAYLEKDTYFLNIRNNNDNDNIYTYNLIIDEVIDDVEDYINIEFSDNKTLSISIDYANDIDKYRFTINEPSMYDVKYLNHPRYNDFLIKDVNDHIVYSYSNEFNIYKNSHIYLIPGDYYFEFTSHIIENYTISFTKNNEETDDYMSSSSFESNMGILNLGSNNVSIDYDRDTDTYIFKVEKSGYYPLYLDLGGSSNIFYHDEYGNRSHTYWQFLSKYFEVGNYYFTIYNEYKNDGLLNIGYFDDTTSIDEENINEYSLSTQNTIDINGQLNYVDDIDYYKIIVEETGVLSFNDFNLSPYLSYKFIDDNENILIHKLHNYSYYIDGDLIRAQDIDYYVTPGVYTLEVTDESYCKYNYSIGVNFNTQIVDDYDNSINSSAENFGTLNLGLNTYTYDYLYDTDVFVLEIKEDKYYYFNFNTEFYNLYVYNNNFELKTRHNISKKSFYSFFEAGTYYFEIRGKESIEVSLIISENET